MRYEIESQSAFQLVPLLLDPAGDAAAVPAAASQGREDQNS
jgi:hypothetical protein